MLQPNKSDWGLIEGKFVNTTRAKFFKKVRSPYNLINLLCKHVSTL